MSDTFRPLANLIRRHADIARPLRPAVVADVSGWAADGAAFITVIVGDAARRVVYRDGRAPVVGATVQVARMGPGAGDGYLALPLPLATALVLRIVQPFVVPAFDNTWHLAHDLGKGSAVHDPDDDAFAVVLGRRNDNSWEIRANYPHSAASYAAQSGGGTRDGMMVRMGANAVGSGYLPAGAQLTWAYPADGSDPGTTVNAYSSDDDGATWAAWTAANGLLDLGYLLGLTGYLQHGGRQFGHYLTSGDPRSGATFRAIPISGRHWRYCWCEQIATSGEISVTSTDLIGLLGPEGLTVYEYTRGAGIGTTRTLTATHGPYAMPESTDAPWLGFSWVVGHSADTLDGDVWLLPGRNHDRSTVQVWKASLASLRAGGLISWSVAYDPSSTSLDRSKFVDYPQSETNLYQQPNLWGVGATWPYFDWTFLSTSPFAHGPWTLADGSEAAFTPPGAAAGATPPRLDLLNVYGFEQFRATVADAFAFQGVNYAFTGPDPGDGAAFDGDGDLATTPVYGPRLYAIYQDPADAMVKVLDSSGTLRADTSPEGEQYAFWGAESYARLTSTGVGSVWWDVAE